MTYVLPYCASTAVLPTLVDDLDTRSLLTAAAALATVQGCNAHRSLAKLTRRSYVSIDALPGELLHYIVGHQLDVRELCTLAQVSPRFRHVSDSEDIWEQLYVQKFGQVTSVVREAACLAKTWKELYKCKMTTDRQADPWLKPCAYELAAIHHRIAKRQQAGQTTSGVLFLLDGSGSVFQDDFQAMTDFVSKTFTELMQANAKSKVGVIQFSTGIDTHLPLDNYPAPVFQNTLDDMARMNGGTNLALAVDTAGQMLRDNLPVGSPRTIIILTDGRIDYYQGEETVQAIKNIDREQGNLSVYAFGIGCGVGRAELLNIVSANNCTDPECHYMPLAVHPDPDYRW